MNDKLENTLQADSAEIKTKGVRKILLMGIFWRILIIELILLVWSLYYRVISDPHVQSVDLFWYSMRITLLVAIIILFVMVTFRHFLNKKIILPLESISASNRRLRDSDSTELYIDLPDDSPNEIQEIIATRKEMLETILKVSEERLRLTNFIRDMFGRYLSKKIVDSILESPEGHKIGGRRETVTILMSDIRGFTSLSESLEPERLVQLLNRYLERMSKIILDYDGIIDEIIGDSIMAVFGVPEKRDTDPQRAVACALAMQNALVDLNNEFTRQGYPYLEMGIGINTGNVIVGNIGSELRMKYGVVGAAVNTASRIESNTVGGQVMIGESTYHLVKDLVTIETPQAIMMKGIKKPLITYLVKAIGPPYNIELDVITEVKLESHLNLPFSCWKVEDKKIVDGAISGETILLSDNMITATVTPPLKPLADIKLVFDFCVEAHCFEDIYAKVLSVENTKDGTVHHLQITAIDHKDRELLEKWIREASYPGH
ncbi:MAG: adenylate/guanylate cyclase domain-containing protein [Desulfobacteraceae bacterium]|nr:adenylate/guanylate cyclase domain-containing protein [Desulfobacteraceae bacterium]